MHSAARTRVEGGELWSTKTLPSVETAAPGFYDSVAAALEAAGKLDYGGLLYYVRSASKQWWRYLKERGITYTPAPDEFYDRLVVVKSGDNPAR
jgi:hypothetical protein